MHTASNRRHPLQSFPFWFMMLSGIAVLAAWKLGFFNGTRESAETFTPVAGEPELLPGILAGASAESTPTGGVVALDVDGPQTSAPVENVEPAQPLERESAADTTPRQTAMADGQHHGVTQISFTMPESGGARDAAAQPLQLIDDVANELREADRLIAVGNDVGAHRVLSTAYWSRPASRAQLQSRLDELSGRIYFSPRHYLEQRVVQPGESLASIAADFQVTTTYLARVNNVDPQRVPAGTALKVMQGPFQVKVELSRFELTVHSFGYFVARYPIGVGKYANHSAGLFQVTEKLEDPTYYGEAEIINHDDPRNPLGEHWIALGTDVSTNSRLGFHACLDENSIGKKDSPGSLCLRPADVAALFEFLTAGSPVEIVE